ncbi:ectoine/hydroxyectoine ABC transporter substrate-binding protein EhuB [Streptosporangium sp. NBC_01639]|uniref:ectoine/hydroxyectoine ABC transporter substrate-binding protein EhuB n=1 Tax=Streptosporangium sp. NBC_01639 TaxID=2975948 RepID=UPI0038679B9C|nr:ectoine/hydroxyectoine ABC transporter substrate-binding protein EhuB [Streptosporangium sp. NBC_01639]
MTHSPLTRRDFFRRTGVGVAALAVPALVAGCTAVDNGTTTADPKTGKGGLLDRVKSAGKIKVGFANESPYGFRDKDGNLTGEAPELARAILKNLGDIKLEPVLVDSFGALIPGLNAGQYDIIAAGMFVTPERCGQIAFSNPDYAGANAFMVKKGNPKGITTFETVASSGSKIAVLEGAAEQQYARKAGVETGRVQVFQKADDAIRGLTDGRIDAVALTAVTLRWALKENPDYAAELEVTEGFIPKIDGKEQLGAGGYGFRKGDTDLLAAFNAELKKLQDGNGVLPVVKPFGFGETEVSKAAELTAEQLCAAS